MISRLINKMGVPARSNSQRPRRVRLDIAWTNSAERVEIPIYRDRRPQLRAKTPARH